MRPQRGSRHALQLETHFTRLPIEAHRSPADLRELGIEQLWIALVMDDHRRRVANRFDQLENRDQRARWLKPAHVDVNAIRRDPALGLRKRSVEAACIHDFFFPGTREDRAAGPDPARAAPGAACAAIVSSTRVAMMSFSTSLAPS